MFTFITAIFSLFIVALAGWTLLTFVTKDDSQKVIKEELGNIFEITKMLLASIKGLIQILIRSSFPSASDRSIDSDKSTELDEQLLKFVPPISSDQEDKAA